MAKLNAPLFSFRASGAIAKALVYFGWKGLNVVRSYVVPTNPNTTLQQTQRGYLTAAVARIHAAQLRDPDGLDEDDQIAYALLGSTYPTPRTWFNQLVKGQVDLLVASEVGLFLCNGAVAKDVASQLTFSGKLYSALSVAGFLYWGTSKTNMPNRIAADAVVGDISAVASPTVKGTKYYLQWRITAGEGSDGMRSGIYTAISI